MPEYRKSYKKSKNSKNSKSGGRRRKHTMRKYRRGKKVMRGGDYTNTQIMEGFNKLNSDQKFQFLGKMGGMYGNDPEIFKNVISMNSSEAQKAINLLKVYNVLT